MSASGGDFKKSWEFHTAPCSDIDVANTLIHLPINTISTLVLASSNFFIQILNSPSRTAVDKIHTKGQWLDVGILYLRNAFHLSRWKLCVCLGLFLTSIPIHIFFNSSIFVIDTRMGDFNILIAAEAFVNRGAFYVPGASVSTKQWRNRGIFSSVSVNQTIGDDTMVTARNFPDAIPNISAIAAEASGWQRLDKVACRRVYADEHCEGLREFRNVVMVTGGGRLEYVLFESFSIRPEAAVRDHASKRGEYSLVQHTMPHARPQKRRQALLPHRLHRNR